MSCSMTSTLRCGGLAAMDTFVAYQPLLEDVILPQPERLFAAMKELAEF